MNATFKNFPPRTSLVWSPHLTSFYFCRFRNHTTKILEKSYKEENRRRIQASKRDELDAGGSKDQFNKQKRDADSTPINLEPEAAMGESQSIYLYPKNLSSHPMKSTWFLQLCICSPLSFISSKTSKEKEKENLYHLYNIHTTFSLQNYALNHTTFKFIDSYQSPGTTTDGLDWHHYTLFSFFLLWKITSYKPHMKKKKKERKKEERKKKEEEEEKTKPQLKQSL